MYDETLLVRFHKNISTYVATPYLYYKTPYRLEILIELANQRTLSGALVKILRWDWEQQDALIGSLSIDENNVLSNWLLEPEDSSLADYLRQVLLAFITFFRKGTIPQSLYSNVKDSSKYHAKSAVDRLDNNVNTVTWWQVWFINSPDTAQSYTISHPQELYSSDEEVIGYQASIKSHTACTPMGLVMWRPGEPFLFWEHGTYPGLHKPLPVEKMPELLRHLTLP
ncbi:MAG TPA: hypothetical protein H9821_09060 [Candidatus Rothia avicola]|uniref:Uncharacterized protein n=1 Tax=Candidatus Rothia avicola TaxID=2840478 RepID=A0A9D1ZXC4_9MICC|nr:hypothetical protein [Candidatus Rothia avicola]